MADKPKLSEEEQAAHDAQTATRTDEQSWASKIEERLEALEAKVKSQGKGGKKADDGGDKKADDGGDDEKGDKS